MVILLIGLLSICVIYFTHLFYAKKMKVASISIAVLYFTLLIWIYFIFVLDVVKLGYNESRMAALIGSDIFHSFTGLRDYFYNMPDGFHIATVFVAITVAVFVIADLIVCGIRIHKQLFEQCKKVNLYGNNRDPKTRPYFNSLIISKRLFILNCRLNN